MKVVSWNLRNGGTKNKLNAICDQLTIWTPDVIGLSEFRESKKSQSIADQLRDLGLIHQTTTADANERGMNFLMLASRLPMKAQFARSKPVSNVAKLRRSKDWLDRIYMMNRMPRAQILSIMQILSKILAFLFRVFSVFRGQLPTQTSQA